MVSAITEQERILWAERQDYMTQFTSLFSKWISKGLEACPQAVWEKEQRQ